MAEESWGQWRGQFCAATLNFRSACRLCFCRIMQARFGTCLLGKCRPIIFFDLASM